MLTLILAVAHSRSQNSKFQPTLMYFGTFLLDYAIIMSIFGHNPNFFAS